MSGIDLQDYAEASAVKKSMATDLQTIDQIRFLGEDDKQIGVFFEEREITDENGEKKQVIVVPDKYLPYLKAFRLINSPVYRSGNMTVKEARIERRYRRAAMLRRLIDLPSDEYTAEDMAFFDALAAVERHAIQDNVQGWRGKLFTSLRQVIEIATERRKEGGFLRRNK